MRHLCPSLTLRASRPRAFALLRRCGVVSLEMVHWTISFA